MYLNETLPVIGYAWIHLFMGGLLPHEIAQPVTELSSLTDRKSVSHLTPIGPSFTVYGSSFTESELEFYMTVHLSIYWVLLGVLGSVAWTAGYLRPQWGRHFPIYITMKVSTFSGVSILQEAFLSILSKLDATPGMHWFYCLQDLFCTLCHGQFSTWHQK